MNKIPLFAVLLCVSSLLLSCDEATQFRAENDLDSGKEKLSAEQRERLKELFLQRVDQDQDGHISAKERREAQKRIIERFDRDGDGKISEEERKAAQEAFRIRRERWQSSE